jgi:hypothetical protein
MAFTMAIVLGACSAVPVAERSVCIIGTVTGDTIVGSIKGAGQALRSAGYVNCTQERPCVAYLVIVSATGVVLGGAHGLGRGFARAEQDCANVEAQR